MKGRQSSRVKGWIGVTVATMLGAGALVESAHGQVEAKPAGKEIAQVPSWSKDDLNFFLHGSMSTEVVPELVLKAFIETYSDHFPSKDFSHLGLLPDSAFGWPVGFSRENVPHLGGLSSVGINCAACHVDEVQSADAKTRLRVLGVTSHFDSEAFFGSIVVATFRTADPANMQQFLANYFNASEPSGGERAQQLFIAQWHRQQPKILEAMKADPMGAAGIAPGALHPLAPADLRLNRKLLGSGEDLAALSHSMLKLFHNMRVALHVPEPPSSKTPPPSGPGRNDAFGALSGSLFGEPQPYAPVKYGLVWNLEKRPFVHWDGNTRSPLARNLLASLGLGAPLLGKHGQLDFALVKRQTDISEKIHPPRYPFAINHEAAARGEPFYKLHCASCHTGLEDDNRLHSPERIGTDPLRAKLFTQKQADRFNVFLASLETSGYQPPAEPGIRSTEHYWAASLAGVWARSPYLHNGSIRTMDDLLKPAAGRAKTFHRGSRAFDEANMGFADDGYYVFDTSIPGNKNIGHEYGVNLSNEDKADLIEYLKTL